MPINITNEMWESELMIFLPTLSFAGTYESRFEEQVQTWLEVARERELV